MQSYWSRCSLLKAVDIVISVMQTPLIQGRFGIGESFSHEAELACEESLKQPFEHMHMVLEQVRPFVRNV